MELPLFDQVNDLLQALTPADLGELHSRAHRRGVKVWFNVSKPPREHYEAQVFSRQLVDANEGMALEIGFHSEHGDSAANEATLKRLLDVEPSWRKQLGSEAEAGPFFGAPNWRRVSEVWMDPDLGDPDLAFEVASRLVDYMVALQPPHAGR